MQNNKKKLGGLGLGRGRDRDRDRDRGVNRVRDRVVCYSF